MDLDLPAQQRGQLVGEILARFDGFARRGITDDDDAELLGILRGQAQRAGSHLRVIVALVGLKIALVLGDELGRDADGADDGDGDGDAKRPRQSGQRRADGAAKKFGATLLDGHGVVGA